ncbi:ef hand family protein [Stylonychia lemnae]|uniref:Ef hand family protein n=1 Tax=Stylonychia lemnae TaxID=5949 RepID=A0A078AIQ6_STYLE|nr:ef hand family protein [Stylonychia lemnae]|eukprot:CDW82155.1 ef hand family protein [Stylonychia lemnae]
MEFAMTQVLEQELSLFRMVELIREKIFKRRDMERGKDVNYIQVFNQIDAKNKNYVTRKDLIRFINKFVEQNQYGTDDIAVLFRRLSLAEDCQQIPYLDFVNMLLPSETRVDQSVISTQNEDEYNYQEDRTFDSHKQAIDFSSNVIKPKKSDESNQRRGSLKEVQVKYREVNNSSRNQESNLKKQGSKHELSTRKKSSMKQIIQSGGKDQQQITFTNMYRSTKYTDDNDENPIFMKPNTSNLQSQRKSTPNVISSRLKYSQARLQNYQVVENPRDKSRSQSKEKKSKYYQLRQDKSAMNEVDKSTRKISFMEGKATRNNNDIFGQQKQQYNPNETQKSSLYVNTIDSPDLKNKKLINRTQIEESHSPQPVNLLTNQRQYTLAHQSNSKVQKNQTFDQKHYDVYHKLRRGYVSPMKGREEDVFVDILKQQLKLECELEDYKEELILYCHEFNPVLAFRIFVPKTERISRNINIFNVIEAFKSMGITLKMIEAELMLKRFDSNRDGHLTYTDICDVFRPKNLSLAREFDQRMPFDHQVSNYLAPDTMKYIAKLFKSYVSVESNIEKMKRQLARRPSFDIDDAFSVLNIDGYKKVSLEDMQHILKVHGLIAFQKQANALFTRYDKDKDGLINFEDFSCEITPIKKK